MAAEHSHELICRHTYIRMTSENKIQNKGSGELRCRFVLLNIFDAGKSQKDQAVIRNHKQTEGQSNGKCT